MNGLNQPSQETKEYKLALAQTSTDWMDDSACRDMDTNLFFPEKGGRGPSITREAKAVCHACPVISDCLEYALHLNVREGIWGGLTPTDRSRERRRRLRNGEMESWTKRVRMRSIAPDPNVKTHGTHAGYVAGCGCPLCVTAQSKYDADRWKVESARDRAAASAHGDAWER